MALMSPPRVPPPHRKPQGRGRGGAFGSSPIDSTGSGLELIGIGIRIRCRCGLDGIQFDVNVNGMGLDSTSISMWIGVAALFSYTAGAADLKSLSGGVWMGDPAGAVKVGATLVASGACPALG